MNPVWKAFIDIDLEWSELLKSEKICNQLAAVAQNPQDETFDLVKSCETLDTAYQNGITPSREDRGRRKSLLLKMYAVLHSNYDGVNKDVVMWWLFENSVRLQKLLIAARFDAYRTLASFSASDGTPVQPGPRDIPSYIVGLWNYVDAFIKQHQEKYRDDYFTFELRSLNRDFVNLCPPASRQACVAATDLFYAEEETKKKRKLRP